MALFDREDETISSDAGTRALSVAAVENDFVARVYEKLANVVRPCLRPYAPSRPPGGHRTHGHQASDKVLEVGVGTGINTSLYPRNCHVTGIDLSAPMLEKARERGRARAENIRLLEMDAANLTFADNSFDIVYAPYLVSVVPDPVKVVREMRRVCRPGGKIIVLNHFRSANRMLSSLERAISPFTVHIGFKSDLDLPGFLAQADLKPISIEKVNFPKIWSLVTCSKD
jgi:phosphatidylethanolamine/phosphatidyl-N-methylethanolamine N-methyltransferase